MVQNVNGYACSNPAQVALARRGIDPAAARQAAGAQGAMASAPAQALALAGPQSPLSTADPARTGRGRFVDLVA